MRRLILLAFITFLTRDVTLSKVHRYPSNLQWLFSSSKLSNNEEEKGTVCESEECENMADMILGSMNRSVDPCDDFYEYACGKWPEKYPIPKGKKKWNMIQILQSKTYDQVQEIVNAKSTENDLKPVKLAKKWFKACMDTNAIEKQGIDPLVSTLLSLGGWPMIMEPSKWNEQEYSWQKVDDQYMRLTGRNTFHDVRIQKVDSKVVEIDTPHLPPGSKQLRSAITSDSEEEDEEEDDEEDEEEKSKSDEDPSDEEEQSEEEPGSEDEDDSKIVDDDHDDDDDGDDNDMSEQDEGVRKEIGKNKVTGKIGHGRNKKLQHIRQRKSSTRIIKKHNSHKTKRQRIRRWAIAEVDSKRTQRFSRREKLYARKDKRNHVRKVHKKSQRTKKLLDNEKTVYTTATPQTSVEETNGDNEKIALVQQYADYISKVARIIAKQVGTEISQERLDKDIQDMINFQLKLIQITSTKWISKIIFDLEITLGCFQEWYNKKNLKTAKSMIDWVNKIKALFDEVNESVDDDLSLDIMSPNYIENLVSLLDKTSNRTIVNYVHWNFISKMIKTTTSKMTALYDSWEKASKDKNPGERVTICMQSGEINDILAYEFVRKYFSDDLMKTASNMINDVQKEVKCLIKESDWKDEAKDFALAKVKNLKRFIGYPNWFKNTTIIQEYYKELVIGSSYYENVLRYNKYTKWKSLRKLSKNIDKTDVDELLDPLEVNAFFMPLRNALALPAADFQSPWFSYDRPRYINFGIVGFVMAHEVNHGFDNSGHMFDKDGVFLGWFSSMADEYDEKKDCFVEQFNNYPIDKTTNKKIKVK